jgi:hypothetical protein
MADVKPDYDIETDSVMFQKGQHFDVLAVGKAQSPWWNRTLCEVNNAWVRLGVMEGDFHCHRHDDTTSFSWSWKGISMLNLRVKRSRSSRARPLPFLAASCIVPTLGAGQSFL